MPEGKDARHRGVPVVEVKQRKVHGRKGGQHGPRGVVTSGCGGLGGGYLDRPLGPEAGIGEQQGDPPERANACGRERERFGNLYVVGRWARVQGNGTAANKLRDHRAACGTEGLRGRGGLVAERGPLARARGAPGTDRGCSSRGFA